MDMIHCILRYLNESLEQGVVYNSHGHLNVEAFTCANWARSKYDWRSSTGYCTLVIGIIILEDNKKKNWWLLNLVQQNILQWPDEV